MALAGDVEDDRLQLLQRKRSNLLSIPHALQPDPPDPSDCTNLIPQDARAPCDASLARPSDWLCLRVAIRQAVDQLASTPHQQHKQAEDKHPEEEEEEEEGVRIEQTGGGGEDGGLLPQVTRRCLSASNHSICAYCCACKSISIGGMCACISCVHAHKAVSYCCACKSISIGGMCACISCVHAHKAVSYLSSLCRHVHAYLSIILSTS
jgi:hypothetical protein